MSREPWWAVHDRHFEEIGQVDVELEAAQEMALAMESETWFAREGAAFDCA
jgi:hypothetical protein